MLLQKTGSRIKQFINHRRRSSYGDPSENYQDDRSTEERFPAITYRRLSWLSQSPPVAPILQRFNDGSTLPSRRLTPTVITARSSLSSLCSCECDPVAATSNTSFLYQEPASLASETLCSQQQHPFSYRSSEVEAWRHIFPEKADQSALKAPQEIRPRTSSLKQSMGGPTFDLIEALAIDPLEEDATPRQSISSGESARISTERLSDNVEQLIRETDEAFRAVGNVLTDTEAPSFGWYGPPPLRPVTQAVAASRNPAKKRSVAPSAPPPNSLFLRSTTVPKVKRKTIFKKAATLGGGVKEVLPPPANTPARWTFIDVTTTVADALNRKIFRSEVDEVTVQGPMQQVRGQLRIDTDVIPSRNSSSRSSDTEGSTPKEPFHLEYLSARLKSVSNNASASTSPNLLPSALPNSPPLPSVTTRIKSVQFVDPPADVTGIMTFKDLNFPSPPRTSSHNWSTQPHSPTNFLPTIPEISPLTHILPRSYDRRAARCQLASRTSLASSTSFLFLRSTAYTRTSPLYRHRPIRIERACKNRKASARGSERREKLDWTTNQMAVSGTIDEGAKGRSKSSDVVYVEEEVDLIYLRKWWNGMGSEFVGGLDYGEVVNDYTLEDISTPILDLRRTDTMQEVITRHDSIYLHPAPHPPTDRLPPIPRTEGKSPTDKMPPSPLPDLKAGKGQKDKDIDSVGYDLGHDLDDFLNRSADASSAT